MTALLLESLATGAKPYSELPYSPALDFQLTRLLSEGKIVRTYNRGILYSLPIVPPQDRPLPPSREVLALQKPRKNQYTLDSQGRKRCNVCRRRFGRSRFMYRGKMWGACYGCREKPEPVA